MMLKDYVPQYFTLGVQVPGCYLQLDKALAPLVLENFNSITPGTNFGLRRTYRNSDIPDFSAGDWVCEYLKDEDIEIDGHCLLRGDTSFARWNGLTNLEIEGRLKKSVQAIVDRYRDVVHVWEVLGEVVSPRGGLTNTFWKKRLGPEFAVKMYLWVHEVCPSAALYYSDYGMESGDKRDAVLSFCQSLKEYGVPLEGVSFQFHHFTKGAIALGKFKSALRQCFDLGFEAKISEVTIWQDLADIGVDLELLQAHCYGKLLDMAIAQGVQSVTFWNPFDAYSWRHTETEPGLWDDRLKPKLAYFEIEKVLRRWKKKEPDSLSQAPGEISLNSPPI